MPTNYVFLDDQPEDTLAPFIKAVERAANDLRIYHRRPRRFEKTIELLREGLGRNKQEKTNGYIVDLRLNEEKVPEEDRATYPGQTVAQQLRSMMARDLIEPVPIVVWSVDNRIESYYAPDDTARDLFDRIYGKDVELVADPQHVAEEMLSLSKGYEKIRKERQTQKGSFERMLALTAKSSAELEPRIGEAYRGTRKASVHELARYIHRVIILSRSPLIDEDVLAARLGVNRTKSPGWEAVKSAVSNSASYGGVFGEAWPRWWSARIEEWWRKEISEDESLRRLGAEARVKFLRKVAGRKKLVPAKPSADGESDRFWTVCEATKHPLDPIDGFRTPNPVSEELSWHEPLYLSLKAVIDGQARKAGYKLHPLERARFNELRTELKKQSGS